MAATPPEPPSAPPRPRKLALSATLRSQELVAPATAPAVSTPAAGDGVAPGGSPGGTRLDLAARDMVNAMFGFLHMFFVYEGDLDVDALRQGLARVLVLWPPFGGRARREEVRMEAFGVDDAGPPLLQAPPPLLLAGEPTMLTRPVLQLHTHTPVCAQHALCAVATYTHVHVVCCMLLGRVWRGARPTVPLPRRRCLPQATQVLQLHLAQQH